MGWKPSAIVAAATACLVWTPASSAGQARGSDADASLEVRIEEPHGGVVSGPTANVTAEVSDPEVTRALLVVNGSTYHVPVEQGRIAQRVVAVPGNNRVAVVIRKGDRTARDSRTFRYRGDPVEMIVLLTWPSEGEIVDLWVREPGGETCKWDHRSTESGGRLLDFSTDAIGFGSQAFVLQKARPGRFRVKVHYWGGWAESDQRGWWAYRRMLSRVEELDRRVAETGAGAERRRLADERDRTRAKLDAWAAPAAPQTPVHAEVVLFPGTAAERRWRFDVIVQRTGQLLTLGEIEVSEQMVRAARQQGP